MVDIGHGPPVVLIPGIQGRWEWMRPAVDALSDRCRVITDSLPGDHGSLHALDPRRGFETHLDWVDDLLDRAELEHATICGVSYGGLVALHYAACRPSRTNALVLSSTPSPTWRPNCQVERYLRAPRLMSPVFALSSPFRLYPEIAEALPDLLRRSTFVLDHLYRVARYPFAPTKMAQRVRLMAELDFLADCTKIEAPTLVVTGSPGLDRVVQVSSTREYLRAIDGASGVEIEGTGHIGLITKPDRFADTVGQFASSHVTAPQSRMQVSA